MNSFVRPKVVDSARNQRSVPAVFASKRGRNLFFLWSFFRLLCRIWFHWRAHRDYIRCNMSEQDSESEWEHWRFMFTFFCFFFFSVSRLSLGHILGALATALFRAFRDFCQKWQNTLSSSVQLLFFFFLVLLLFRKLPMSVRVVTFAATAACHSVSAQKVIQKFLDKFGIEIENETMKKETGQKYCSSTFGKYSFPIDFLLHRAKSQKVASNVIIHKRSKTIATQLLLQYVYMYIERERYTNFFHMCTYIYFFLYMKSSEDRIHTHTYKHSVSIARSQHSMKHTLIHFIYFRLEICYWVRFYIWNSFWLFRGRWSIVFAKIK